MQLIYGGKNSKGFPRVKFPESFTVSSNEKHYSNKQESLKLLDDVIIPYVEMEKEKLELPTQAVLMIMDASKDEMTTPALQKIGSNNIQLAKVPPNLAHFYQPLEVTLNDVAKQIKKRKFADWYARQIFIRMNRGTNGEQI